MNGKRGVYCTSPASSRRQGSQKWTSLPVGTLPRACAHWVLRRPRWSDLTRLGLCSVREIFLSKPCSVFLVQCYLGSVTIYLSQILPTRTLSKPRAYKSELFISCLWACTEETHVFKPETKLNSTSQLILKQLWI